MNVEPAILSKLLVIFLPLVCFVVVLLLLRFAAKLKWLTAVCVAVLISTVFFIIGLRMLHPGSHFGVGWVFFVPAAVSVVVLAIQFFCWLFSSPSNAQVNVVERNRILQMVEDGKISTDEGTELLEAMGRSTALQGQDKFSRTDIAVLCGVALVVLGFFLPWVYVTIPGMSDLFGRASAYQAGYHAKAIGWAVFIIAILSAVPVFVTPRNFLYKISMLQIFLILVGLVLVVSVLIRAGENLGAGLIFCLVGFIVELFSSGAKLKSLAA
jgi:hypothetical protein